jgi:hypothetical protein
MEMLKKIMEQKTAKPLDPLHKEAKMSMLKELRDSMSGIMKDDLSNAKGMKKVEVAGSSDEAVAEGLDKAKEMVSDESEEEIALPGMDSLTPEKIDMLIQMLQKKKDEMSTEDSSKGGMI